MKCIPLVFIFITSISCRAKHIQNTDADAHSELEAHLPSIIINTMISFRDENYSIELVKVRLHATCNAWHASHIAVRSLFAGMCLSCVNKTTIPIGHMFTRPDYVRFSFVLLLFFPTFSTLQICVGRHFMNEGGRFTIFCLFCYCFWQFITIAWSPFWHSIPQSFPFFFLSLAHLLFAFD